MSRELTARALSRTWTRAERGELLLAVLGGPGAGHLGSSLGGRTHLPHRPTAPSALATNTDIARPALTAPLAAGGWSDDEWAHDPAMWGWITGVDPGDHAVRLGDALTHAGARCRLALSNRRLAVLVEAGEVASGEPAQASPRGHEAGFAGRLGGLLRQVRGGAGERGVVALHEVDRPELRSVSAAPLGRAALPEWFLGFTFVDGSSLLVRHEDPEQLVETLRLNP
ncbi:hypothetical protein C1701_09555 [Actinoalloteichus sp. AHMU CJ021]|uniref:hypothetical protein n=1 Tax=Actinoalloteichus sp. AHMU CJ021 TaxID=2072503 RepID=UPI000CA06D95|nr:hypothetical protein C1701_09555 [Actinoalloteichus sp. AHMU CJ021]